MPIRPDEPPPEPKPAGPPVELTEEAIEAAVASGGQLLTNKKPPEEPLPKPKYSHRYGGHNPDWKPGVKITVTQIHEAMIAARDDRAMAAKALGKPISWLKSRINNNPGLKAAFCRKATLIRQRQELLKARSSISQHPEVVDLMAKQTDEFAVAQATVSRNLIGRLAEVQERIRKGNQVKELEGIDEGALTPEQKTFIRTYRFAINDNQDEEKKLLEHERNLIEQHTKSLDVFGTWAHNKAKIEVMMSKLKPKGNQGKPLAAPPKERKVTNITHIHDSNVVVQPQPIANVADAQSNG